jgi:hypothetical protein
MIYESLGGDFELEPPLLQRFNDLCFTAQRHNDVVGKVSGDKEDRTGKAKSAIII